MKRSNSLREIIAPGGTCGKGIGYAPTPKGLNVGCWFVAFFYSIYLCWFCVLWTINCYPEGVKCHSTPSGLWPPSLTLPRFHLGLFIFNPFRVEAVGWFPPGFTWGYSYSTPSGLRPLVGFPQVSPGAIHIQPLQGWSLCFPFPQVSMQSIFLFRVISTDFDTRNKIETRCNY